MQNYLILMQNYLVLVQNYLVLVQNYLILLLRELILRLRQRDLSTNKKNPGKNWKAYPVEPAGVRRIALFAQIIMALINKAGRSDINKI